MLNYILLSKKWEFIDEHIKASNSSYRIGDHFILLGLIFIFYIFSSEHYWIIPKRGANKCFWRENGETNIFIVEKINFRVKLRMLGGIGMSKICVFKEGNILHVNHKFMKKGKLSGKLIRSV